MALTRRVLQRCGLLVAVWLVFVSQAMADGAAIQPPLQLADLDGHTRRLDEWHGKLLLVNFWATWCAPCQAEIPSLMRFQTRHGGKGMQIIGVGFDEPDKLRNFRNSYEMNYPVLVAVPERSVDILAVWGNSRGIVPYSVLLDSHGRVLETVTGVIDDELLDDLVLPHLNPPPSKITSRR